MAYIDGFVIAVPTAKIVTVCPNPQKAPIRAARASFGWRVTIVETAMTWSGSVACRIPRKNPTASIERVPIMDPAVNSLNDRSRARLGVAR